MTQDAGMLTEFRATRRAVVRTGARLAYTAPLVAATMKLSAQGSLAAASSADCLGSVWTDVEGYGEWVGTWTRIGANTFRAIWVHLPGVYPNWPATLVIEMECRPGGSVTVHRSDTLTGTPFFYRGTFDGANAVSGVFGRFPPDYTDAGPWSATIS